MDIFAQFAYGCITMGFVTDRPCVWRSASLTELIAAGMAHESPFDRFSYAIGDVWMAETTIRCGSPDVKTRREPELFAAVVERNGMRRRIFTPLFLQEIQGRHSHWRERLRT